jgi:hypothetical protein
MIKNLPVTVLQVLSVHQGYSLAMRERAKKGFPIGSIGDILSNMFLGKIYSPRPSTCPFSFVFCSKNAHPDSFVLVYVLGV